MPEKILIIKHGALGDWITATGAYKLIRERHPTAHITLLTQSTFVNFAKETGWFNATWIDNRDSFFSLKTWRVIWKIKGAQFNIVYDIQCSSRTEIYRRLLQRKKMVWHARTEDSEENYQGLPTPHILVRIARRIAATGISEFPMPDIGWLKADISKFHLPEKYVLVIPGCSKIHAAARRWTAEGYAAFIEAMFQQGLICVIIGTKEDQDIIDPIAALTKKYEPINLINQCSLAQVAELSRNALAAFGSDTGTMHIAGLCCPCLSLFSNFANPETNKSGGKKVYTIQVPDLKKLDAKVVIGNFNQILGKKCVF
ncbi:MAG: glycosyltransferase family 9 protein [Coxiellaceae bacterium]|nr:glycosyltransferase family 9 protein [Coxiellaceae bacterium]